MDEFKQTYRDVAITFNAKTAKFEATLNSETVRAPSVDGVKRKIDKLQSFPVFTALIEQGYGAPKGEVICTVVSGKHRRSLIRVKIVTTKTNKWHGDDFIDQFGDSHTPGRLIEDVPGADTVWKAIIEAEYGEDERHEKVDKEIKERYRRDIPWRKSRTAA